MKLKFYIPLLISIMFALNVKGQDIAVKTNLLYDLTATVNAGVEVGVAPKWSLDLSGNLNAWNMGGDKKWKHWMVQPEVRYWFCDRFAGHFVAAHFLGGQYNVGGFGGDFELFGIDFEDLKTHRYQGWYGGVGIAYGYAWILGKHWNLEAEIGVGYVNTKNDKYECAGCGKKVKEDRKEHYVGPTKAALSLVYVF